MKKLDVILLSIALVLIVVLLGGKADVATNSFDFSIIVRLILALFLLFYIFYHKRSEISTPFDKIMFFCRFPQI